MKRQFARLAAALLALSVAEATVSAQTRVRVPASVLQRYAGEYDQGGSIIKVYARGDTLFRETPGQRVVLVPMSETMFRMGLVFTAEFVTDATGGVTQVVSDGIDIEYRLPRKGARPAPPAPMPVAAVRVPRSVLERYVGTYEFIPGQMGRTDLRVVIRLEGDKLVRKTMSAAEDAVLTPVSETLFRVRNTRMLVEFVVDEAGVTQVMGSGFQQMLARLTNR